MEGGKPNLDPPPSTHHRNTHTYHIIAMLSHPSKEETRSSEKRVEAEEREIKACFLSFFSLLVIGGSQIWLPSLHITLYLSFDFFFSSVVLDFLGF
jgi:hypothetical protein